MPPNNKSNLRAKLLIGFGVVILVGVAYWAGFRRGRIYQLRGDDTGSLVRSVHLYTLAEAGNIEKLKQDLRFLIYAQYDVRERLGGNSETSKSSDGQSRMLEKAKTIHSLMKTQVVSFTPKQFMEELNAQAATNPPAGQ